MQQRVYEKRVNDVDKLCRTVGRTVVHLTFQVSQQNHKVVRQQI